MQFHHANRIPACTPILRGGRGDCGNYSMKLKKMIDVSAYMLWLPDGFITKAG
jgi:hypothetical protein